MGQPGGSPWGLLGNLGAGGRSRGRGGSHHPQIHTQNSRNVNSARPESGREAHSSHSLGVNNRLGQEHGWGRPWAPPPGSLPPPPAPQGPPADSLDPLHPVPHLHSCQQPLQLSVGLTPGHWDSRPPVLSLCPGTGCASSGWGGGSAGKGSSLTRGSARGSGGMTNPLGRLSRTQAKVGAQTPGQPQLWPAPPRPQGTLWLPPPQLRPKCIIYPERATS